MKRKISYIVVFLLYLCIISFFAILYVNQENFYNDYRFFNYHFRYINYYTIFLENFFEHINACVNNIQNDTSSFFPLFILSYFGKFIGLSRVGYILSLILRCIFW